MSILQLNDDLLRKILIATMDHPQSFINLSITCQRILHISIRLTKSREWLEKRPVVFHSQCETEETYEYLFNSKYRRYSTLKYSRNYKYLVPNAMLNLIERRDSPDLQSNIDALVEIDLSEIWVHLGLLERTIKLLPKVRYLSLGYIIADCDTYTTTDTHSTDKQVTPLCTLIKLKMAVTHLTPIAKILTNFPANILELVGPKQFPLFWYLNDILVELLHLLGTKRCITNKLILRDCVIVEGGETILSGDKRLKHVEKLFSQFLKYESNGLPRFRVLLDSERHPNSYLSQSKTNV